MDAILDQAFAKVDDQTQSTMILLISFSAMASPRQCKAQGI